MHVVEPLCKNGKQIVNQYSLNSFMDHRHVDGNGKVYKSSSRHQYTINVMYREKTELKFKLF